MIAILLLITFVTANDYRAALKAGQRHFTSDGLKQGDSGMKYDIILVERYHSLDHDGEIESIICGDDSVIMIANQELKDWRAGDVFTGSANWGCGDFGVARIVKEVFLRKEENGRYEYFVKTKQAELTDIFEYAVFNFVDPNQGEPEETTNLKQASSVYEHTFSYEKSKNLVDRTNLQSTIGGKVEVPITLKELFAKIDTKSDDVLQYSMIMSASLKYTLTFDNTIKGEYSDEVEKELYDFTKVKFDLVAGPIVVTITLKPVVWVGAEIEVEGSASCNLKYTKKFTATLTINSEATNKVSYKVVDNTSGNRPTLTCGASVSGSFGPYVKAGVEIGVGYGVTIVSGTPTIKLKYEASLANRVLTIQPKFYLGFTLEILLLPDVKLNEKQVGQGSKTTTSY